MWFIFICAQCVPANPSHLIPIPTCPPMPNYPSDIAFPPAHRNCLLSHLSPWPLPAFWDFCPAAYAPLRLVCQIWLLTRYWPLASWLKLSPSIVSLSLHPHVWKGEVNTGSNCSFPATHQQSLLVSFKSWHQSFPNFNQIVYSLNLNKPESANTTKCHFGTQWNLIIIMFGLEDFLLL